MDTLLLDRTAWDLVLTTSGDIAVASDPYALAQDAASAIRLFYGELWYNTVIGVPYWQLILGQPLSVPVLKAKFVAAALSVPGIVAARVYITYFRDRTVRGQVQVTDRAGAITVAAF